MKRIKIPCTGHGTCPVQGILILRKGLRQQELNRQVGHRKNTGHIHYSRGEVFSLLRQPERLAKLPPQERNQFMLYYLIVCRSLTYAQRTAAALERAGISARILRSPKSISGEGCSHSVKISQRSLPDALRTLQRAQLSPKRIFITAGDGSYQEVEL